MVRSGNVCVLSVNANMTYAQGSNMLARLPEGYRPCATAYAKMSANTHIRLMALQSGDATAYNYGSAVNNVSGSVAYITTDPWPS